MVRIEKYTGEKTYMYPNGALADPDRVLADYPAILTFPHIITTDENGEVFAAIANLSVARSEAGIDPSMSEAEAIAELQRLANTPPVIDTTPSAEERTAAALEFQNMLALASMTTDEGSEPT